jgi:hypothetical protein
MPEYRDSQIARNPDRAFRHGTWHQKQRCQTCGNPDARSPSRARGCPNVKPVSNARLMEIVLMAEAGWEARRQAKAMAAYG